MEIAYEDFVKLMRKARSKVVKGFEPNFKEEETCQAWYEDLGDIPFAVLEKTILKLTRGETFPSIERILGTVSCEQPVKTLKKVEKNSHETQRENIIRELMRSSPARALSDDDRVHLGGKLRYTDDGTLWGYMGDPQEMVYEIFPQERPGYVFEKLDSAVIKKLLGKDWRLGGA